MRYCVICGKEAEWEHHLIGGTARRKLSTEDLLTVGMCNKHHNMAEILSKMLGQAIYERDYVAQGNSLDEARQSFLMRYGRNYLQ